MLVVSGTILVLVTWAACLASAVFAGSLPALASTKRQWVHGSLRRSLWWGVVLLAIAVTAISLVLPLRSVAAAACMLVLLVVLGVPGVVFALQARRVLRPVPRSRMRGTVLLAVGLATAAAYLALAALGPVTNYDTGLYHLGAIAYAGDFRAIPGLANLYFPLGYASAEFPMAAILGNGPWAGEGYRLLNGLLIVALIADFLLRTRMRGSSPGFWLLGVGLVGLLVPMIALSDYWVTSPTSDCAVFVLTTATVAYLSDAVTDRVTGQADGAVALALAVLAVMLRPTMVVFALAVLAVVVISWSRRRERTTSNLVPTAVIGGALIVVAGAVISARDYVLSGWLQFPLSILSFNVPWRSVDPVVFRDPTLGAARDPVHLWESVTGWTWVRPWLSQLPHQWETYEFLALAGAAIVVVALAAMWAGPVRWRPLVATMMPSVVAVAFWWAFTPPSFRFIWGPLFTTMAIPCGWGMWRLSRGGARAHPWRSAWRWLLVLGVSVPVITVVAFSSATRFAWDSLTQERIWTLGVSVPYARAPVTMAEVTERALPSGLSILVPTRSDQCWTRYPVCTPAVAPTVRLRGAGIQEGFLP